MKEFQEVGFVDVRTMNARVGELDITGWTMNNGSNIPQQENASDCSVFSCTYVEFICQNRPIEF